MNASRTTLSLVFSFILMLQASFQEQQIVFRTNTGNVKFISDAPLERITASTGHLKGIIDTARHSFAFSVAVKSFAGFNSPLQREHFNENYMQSSDYPTVSFSGKIIEEIDYSQNGTYDVRAKGLLNIRGIKQERIIRSKMIIDDESIKVESNFNVLLEDHQIKIPRVVFQKISPEIYVEIDALLKPATL